MFQNDPYMDYISNYLHTCIVISITFSVSLGQHIVELLLKLRLNTNQTSKAIGVHFTK